MEQDISTIALKAANDAELRDSLVNSQELFILRSASRASHQRVDKSDDEWSVALIAFIRAIESFDEHKGGFLPYADLLIRRAVVDNFRKQSRFHNEIPVSPCAFDGNVEQEEAETPMQLAVAANAVLSGEDSLKDEIRAAGDIFSRYGFSFFELAECSPKSEKTKRACARAVCHIAKSGELLREMRSSRQLPVKNLVEQTSLPRKIFERHRKYIIAATEIIAGDFPALAEYLAFVRKEGSR